MKITILQGLLTIIIVCLFLHLLSCESGSKKQNKTDSTVFNQEAYNLKTQGVFEILPPNQGLRIAFNNHFIFIIGDSDSTMICQAGTYKVSDDTITYTTTFASKPELVGNLGQWKAEFIGQDTLKAILFDKEGNIASEILDYQKVKASKEQLVQLKDQEGVFQYVDKLQGQSLKFGGYYIYLYGSSDSTMYAHTGIYTINNDTVNNKIKYGLNPKGNGSKFRWTIESLINDTVSYAIVNEKGEATSKGRSFKIK